MTLALIETGGMQTAVRRLNIAEVRLLAPTAIQVSVMVSPVKARVWTVVVSAFVPLGTSMILVIGAPSDD